MNIPLTPNPSELTLQEVRALHQQWLQMPETIAVIKALKQHADNHTAAALQHSTNASVDAHAIKQQASIAYNLHLVVDIISNPDMLHKLLHPAPQQNNNQE